QTNRASPKNPRGACESEWPLSAARIRAAQAGRWWSSSSLRNFLRFQGGSKRRGGNVHKTKTATVMAITAAALSDGGGDAPPRSVYTLGMILAAGNQAPR